MAWEAASQKYVREYGDLLAQAISGSWLVETERDLLRGILRCSPVVVHLQSGHGLDDVALVQGGAKSVVGIDYSQVAVRAAQRRDDVYRNARVAAAQRDASVSALVVAFLEQLSGRMDEFVRLEALQREVQAGIRQFRASDRLSRVEVHARAVR